MVLSKLFSRKPVNMSMKTLKQILKNRRGIWAETSENRRGGDLQKVGAGESSLSKGGGKKKVSNSNQAARARTQGGCIGGDLSLKKKKAEAG